MKKLIIILTTALFISCSSDDANEIDNCECRGQFKNVYTNQIMYQQTDCDRLPPSEDWIFVKCADKPDY